jgi:hypothetical protein
MFLLSKIVLTLLRYKSRILTFNPNLMKSSILIAAFLCAFAVSAQDIKPVFEQDGDLLKGTYFHDNGAIAQVGYFMNGKLHGEWNMFDEAGQRLAKGSYINGEKAGKWFFWKGEELSEVEYVDSKIASVQKWKTTDPMVINK